MPSYSPEFWFNMVMHLSFVFGQTLGMRLIYKLSYQAKFLISLVPVIILMSGFPYIVEYFKEDLAWILSIITISIMGKDFQIYLMTSF